VNAIKDIYQYLSSIESSRQAASLISATSFLAFNEKNNAVLAISARRRLRDQARKQFV
jgi:hypothetical protein